MNNFFNNDVIKICDTHLHLSDLIQKENNVINNKNYFACTSSQSIQEFLSDEKLIKTTQSNIFQTFGIHPQNVFDSPIQKLDFLESLLKQKKIVAIGEIGFDFFSDEFIKTKDAQINLFNIQMEFAQKYNLPIIIHGRKCIDLLFKYSNLLAKIPSVIFHSFSGTHVQAQFFLQHNVNAVFSFSKHILNNNKKAIECVSKLSIKNLLFETDAPYQNIYNESFTKSDDIIKVYNQAFLLQNKNFQIKNFEIFTQDIYNNFMNYLRIV